MPSLFEIITDNEIIPKVRICSINETAKIDNVVIDKVFLNNEYKFDNFTAQVIKG